MSETRISKLEIELAEQLEKLNARQKIIDDRLADIRKKRAEVEDRAATRRKIIAGAWLLASPDPDARALVERLKSTLTRNQDRAAFGLLPTEKQARQEQEEGADQVSQSDDATS